MTKSTKSTAFTPASELLDGEVLAFRQHLAECSPLDEVVREGARRMLQSAVIAEAEQFVLAHSGKVDEEGRRLVVRNGSHPPREIATGAGRLEIQQPRVRDNDPDKSQRVRFSSSLLPRYMRRSPSLDELIPVLYLHGISTGDFGAALESLLGEEAKGFSSNTVVRLKDKWADEHEKWSRRSLAGKHYVYIWADAIHLKVRLGDEENRPQCVLVLMGATPDGKKELIAIQEGYRESEQSWKELLLDLKQRGLKQLPQLAIGDGGLGFWAALRKVFPDTREQRCWVHKTANILNDLPKSMHARVKKSLHAICEAATRADAEQALDHFQEKYAEKHPRAWERLAKDREALLAFYDFPAEHWKHIRTTNPIESAFATIRLRHRRTKGSGSRRCSLAMVFKLGQNAEKRWRRLNGHAKIHQLLQGTKFIDGVAEQDAA